MKTVVTTFFCVAGLLLLCMAGIPSVHSDNTFKAAAAEMQEKSIEAAKALQTSGASAAGMAQSLRSAKPSAAVRDAKAVYSDGISTMNEKRGSFAKSIEEMEGEADAAQQRWLTKVQAIHDLELRATETRRLESRKRDNENALAAARSNLQHIDSALQTATDVQAVMESLQIDSDLAALSSKTRELSDQMEIASREMNAAAAEILASAHYSSGSAGSARLSGS